VFAWEARTLARADHARSSTGWPCASLLFRRRTGDKVASERPAAD
jgi:hypothetical protein